MDIIEKRATKQREDEVVINLLNIQGLTSSKIGEVEQLIENNLDIICLTETQLKISKIDVSNDLEKVEQMRESADKRGGGLMIIYKKNKGILLEKQETNHRDILNVRGKIGQDNINMILVYMSTGSTPEIRTNNLKIKTEIERCIENTQENENLVILGDFNGHLDGLGDQREDNNGKIILDLMQNYNTILLNNDPKCEGKYTWERNEQRSVIDFILVNERMYGMFQDMYIDERKELIDVQDHMLLKAKFNATKQITKRRLEEITYFDTSETRINDFIEEIQRLKENKQTTIRALQEILKEANERYIKRTIKVKSKFGKDDKKIKEPKWITANIKNEISERKRLNRLKRNSTGRTKEELIEKYNKQKKKVQNLIKEAIIKHEKRITEDIVKGKDKNKTLWENINKLRGMEGKQNYPFEVFQENGEKYEEAAREEVANFWRGIFNKHHNDIDEVWSQRIKMEYEINRKKEFRERIFNEHVLDHDYEKLVIKRNRERMKSINIREEEVEEAMSNLKNKSAAGIDNIKPELLKKMKSEKDIVRYITQCFNNEIKAERIDEEWKKTKTILIRKEKKPKMNEFRPISITNTIYKLFMMILRKRIENYLASSEQVNVLQAGFTKKARIEDNITILKYCVEKSYKDKKELYLTQVDFTKAYDSVKRSKLIEAMMEHNIDPMIIDYVAKVYQNDELLMKIGNKQEGIKSSSGIKQGCVISTTLFKLITYLIIKELEKRCEGYKDEKFKIPCLFFADDGLILSETKEATVKNIKILIEVSRKYGLEINKNKSANMLFNSKKRENEEEINGIKFKSEVKYLGIRIQNKRDMFKLQKQESIQRATNLANVTSVVVAKCCNRALIGKTYWKNVALPSILYCDSILNYNANEITKLQTIENGVYRNIFRATRFCTIAALRGEVGASTMKSRLTKNKLLYFKSNLSGRNSLMSEITKAALETNMNLGMEFKRCLSETNITQEWLKLTPQEGIRKHIKHWDTKAWEREMESRTTLEIYRVFKGRMRLEEIYDNGAESMILFRARTNCLTINGRIGKQEEDRKCELCGYENENLEHFILNCPELEDIRMKLEILQRPRIRDENILLGNILFEKEEIMISKKIIYEMWQRRREKMGVDAQI